MRLCSLAVGGCLAGVLPGKRDRLVGEWGVFVGSVWYCHLLVEARVDWEIGLAEREMRRRNETLLDPSKD